MGERDNKVTFLFLEKNGIFLYKNSIEKKDNCKLLPDD